MADHKNVHTAINQRMHSLSASELSSKYELAGRQRRKPGYQWWLVALILVFVISLLIKNPLVHAMSPCITDSQPSYAVTLCFTAPLENTLISGEQQVLATVSVSGNNPGIAKLVFYLDNAYLLIDYQPDYTFILPSNYFIDGAHVLEAEAIMRDGYVTDRVPISLTFQNGISQPPVNNNSFTPSTGSTPAAGRPFVLTAVGDGASGESAAGEVSDLLVSWNPNLFLYLGDVYEKGTSTEFYNWYGMTTYFGRLKAITNPVVGNHEFENGVAPGYFGYWDNIPNYYSYNANGWHLIALDSNASGEIGSPQYDWVVADLAAHPEICTLAYYHHPSFNVGPQGDTPRMNDTWKLLVQNGADIVLTGHDHNYQRWLPLDGKGNPSPGGVTQFVIGGGGHGLRGFVTTDSRLAKGIDTYPEGYGALRIELNSLGAAFQYIGINGAIADSGVIPCNGAPADTTPPSQPLNLTAGIGTGVKPTLNWEAARDETGVASYEVYRDNQFLTLIDGSATSFTDNFTQLDATYAYQVIALDLAGNRSIASNSVSITTPVSGTMRFIATADTFISSSYPTTNYGASDVLRSGVTPDMKTYLRYQLRGVNGILLSAKLRLYANSSSGSGYAVYQPSNNAWDENSLDYTNAPSLANYVGSSGGYNANSWTEVDVKQLINGDSDLNLILAPAGTTSVSFSSREGTNPPELVLEVASSIPSTPTPTPTAVVTPGTFQFSPQADTYVNASNPGSNYGSSTTLRADASPDLHSYLRFSVQGLAGQIVSAKLWIYASSSSSIGYSLRQVSNNSWDEYQTNYNTAPPAGSFIGSSGSFAANSWTIVDITSFVTGSGEINLLLDTPSSASISFSSREGTNPPRLVIDTVGSSPTMTSTFIPPPLPTNTPAPLPTDTPVPLPTHTPTALPTDTPNPLPTDTPTPLPTDTPTALPTYTFTPLPTDTPTALPTHTSTPLPTNTPLPTHTPTPLPTSTPTPFIFTFSPTADAYVYQSKPDTNYGTSNQLRLDSSPIMRSYVQFNVQGISGRISSARLRIFSNSNSSTGLTVYTTTNAWFENQITYNTSPAPASALVSSGPIAGKSWVDVDLTPYITGNGVYSFVLITSSNTGINLSSKETTTPPSLVVQIAP